MVITMVLKGESSFEDVSNICYPPVGHNIDIGSL